MAIVKQPLANRLFNAAQTGVSLWQGQQQAKAGKEFLKSTDGLQQYAPFVHPLTGEMGGVGKQMFDLYGAIQQQQARASAIAQQQAAAIGLRSALDLQNREQVMRDRARIGTLQSLQDPERFKEVHNSMFGSKPPENLDPGTKHKLMQRMADLMIQAPGQTQVPSYTPERGGFFGVDIPGIAPKQPFSYQGL